MTEKKLQPPEVQAEQFRETEAFLRLVRADLRQAGVRNLEAVELGLREALFKDAGRLLEKLYAQSGLSRPGDARRPGEKCHASRSKAVLTLFGRICLRRHYYFNPQTGQGRVPLDRALGLVHSFSPAVVRLSDRAGAREGYQAASQDLRALAALEIEPRQIQRLVGLSAPAVQKQLEQGAGAGTEPIPVMYVEADGPGVPMRPEELAGRRGQQPDGSAKTREVKLGAVFTQTRTEEAGEPVRDYQSTAYVASFETAEDFGGRLRREALRRGVGRAQKVVFLGDAAAWVWELARVNFPLAIGIVDLYHALEHLHALAEGLYGAGPRAKRVEETWAAMLRNDQVQDLIAAAARRHQQLGPKPDDALAKQIAYFANHQDKMLYRTYREQGLFYGSGVVEGGCRAVIGQRLKESGMLWGLQGATNVMVLRCALQGNRWDECWDPIHDSNYLSLEKAG
jgi:hypothetical protein